MSTEIVNGFSKLHKLKKLDFSAAHKNFSKIMLEDFLDKCVDSSKFRVNASVGKGTLSFNWWVSVCNYNFYDKMYGICDGRKLSAQIGYYIAYLFNDDNSKMYLCITQSSTGINKPANKELKEFRRIINKYLLQQLSFPNYCLTDIHNKLTQNSKHEKAKDYEEGTLLALEYDLINIDYDDKKIKNDLKLFIKIYSSLIDILLKKYVDIGDYRYDLVNRIIIKNVVLKSVKPISFAFPEEFIYESVSYDDIYEATVKHPNLDKDTVKQLNLRKPSFKTINGKSRLDTNPKLIKYIIDLNKYKCQACNTETTFMTNKGHMYMEGHHLIPVSLQLKYEFDDYNLDNTDNIVCLCPQCHRAVHYGTYEEIINRLVPLYQTTKMKKVLSKYNIANNFEEFIKLYTL